MRNRKAVLASIVLCLLTVACSNWENTTYRSLSAAKSTIDCASAGYNHNDAQILQYCTGATNPQALYLPQSAQIHDILAKAGTAKDAAVNALITYEAAKAAKGSTDTATLQANVNTAVAALTSDVAQIVALIPKGGK